MSKLTLYFLAFLCVFGCAADGQKFTSVKQTPTDLSQIYIYRPKAFTLGGVGLPIIHSGEQLPHLLHNQGYLNYLAQPGHHKIYVNANDTIDKPLEFDTKPGETYFIKVSIHSYLAVFATSLSLIDQKPALKEIKNCNLSTTGNSLTINTEAQEDAPIMDGIAISSQEEKYEIRLVADEIRKLSKLKDEGIITEEEFQNTKSELLTY